MLNKDLLRAMAEAERMMDEGKIPFVMAPSPNGVYERFAVNQEVMEDLGLRQGQRINTMIMDAILSLQIKRLVSKLEQAAQDVEDSLLDPDFDFRKDMK